jgi:C1A family cysteine protease
MQPIRHQGPRASCLIFAATSAHEKLLSAASHLCVEYLYLNATRRDPAPNIAAGTTMQSVAEALELDGQPLETAWPYLPSQPPMSAWIAPTPIGQVWKAKSQSASTAFNDVTALLDSGKPVILGLVITASFLRCDKSGHLPVFMPDPARAGHAVLAVGHGADALSQKYLLVRNSWGEKWGEAGYGWLSEAYVTKQLAQAAVLQ